MDDKIQKMFKVRAYKQDLDKLGQSLVEGKHDTLNLHLTYNISTNEKRTYRIKSILL